MSDLPPDPRFNQIGGLVLAFSTILELLKKKGVMTEFEVDAVLEAAETAPLVSFVETEEASAYRTQMLFPLRMLRVQNRTWPEGTKPSREAIREFLQGRTHEL